MITEYLKTLKRRSKKDDIPGTTEGEVEKPCPYCMSVWIGALVLIIYVVFNNSIYLFGALAVHRVSNYVHLVVSYLRDLQLNLRAGRAR